MMGLIIAIAFTPAEIWSMVKDYELSFLLEADYDVENILDSEIYNHFFERIDNVSYKVYNTLSYLSFFTLNIFLVLRPLEESGTE